MRQSEVIAEQRYQFGRRLKALRKEQNLTQKQLSQITGVDRSRISHLECGDCTTTFDTVLIIASGLGVTPAELLAGVGVRPEGLEELPVALTLPRRRRAIESGRFAEFVPGNADR